MDDIRSGDGADLRANVFDEFFLQLIRVFPTGLQRDVGVDALTLDLVREADDGRLGRR